MDGFERSNKGSHCSVWFSDQAVKQLEKAKFDASDRAKAFKILEHVSNGQQASLPGEQWKLQGRFASGKPKVPKVSVYAVKAYQLRIYGGFATIGGNLFFLCIEAAKKKKDDADKGQLERVAKKVGEYHD